AFLGLRRGPFACHHDALAVAVVQAAEQRQARWRRIALQVGGQTVEKARSRGDPARQLDGDVVLLRHGFGRLRAGGRTQEGKQGEASRQPRLAGKTSLHGRLLRVTWVIKTSSLNSSTTRLKSRRRPSSLRRSQLLPAASGLDHSASCSQPCASSCRAYSTSMSSARALLRLLYQ